MHLARHLLIITVAHVSIVTAAWFSFALAAVDPEYQERLEQVLASLSLQGIDRQVLDGVFSDDRVALYPEIVSRTGKGFNYMGRRFGLLKKGSIENGKNILKKQRDFLQEIERSFGVDKEIILAILRIETNFGKSTGNRPIFNSLLTLALVENRRQAWAVDELGQLLRLCQERKMDPLGIKGSWAGAFGLAQFIPSSCVKYGMDGDGDGVVDLFRFNDAVSSIANYLRSHGWEMNQAEKNKKAVWSYNHCDSYVNAVFAYAAALKRR